jgi:hypothetical protein
MLPASGGAWRSRFSKFNYKFTSNLRWWRRWRSKIVEQQQVAQVELVVEEQDLMQPGVQGTAGTS